MISNGNGSGPGHRDVEYASELVMPGKHAFVIMGLPEGFLPAKVEAYPESLASFAILRMGDLSPEDARGWTQGKYERGGWIRVENRSKSAARFRFVVRFVPDVAKMTRELGTIVETAWRDGSRGAS